jgi:hypothetical protein
MEPIWACVSVGTVADQTQREPPTVGELIRFWRSQRRLTQMELALGAKLSTKHLSLAEPTLETAAPVAVATAMSGMSQAVLSRSESIARSHACRASS